MIFNHSNYIEFEVDAGFFGDVWIGVEFYYSPAERQTWEEPGCDEQYDIVSITINDVEAPESLLTEDVINAIEKELSDRRGLFGE